MADTEFLEKWNNIIPYIIHEYDLARPTEGFLRNALINYVQVLHIDIAKLNLDTSDGSMKLCQYINHIYKISNDSNSFCWIDLCHPLPKKTAHMLKNILNYLLYFNMLKEDIIDESLQKIEAKDAIQLKKNQLEIENESNKIKLETIARKLNENEILKPRLEKSIKNLQADKIKLSQKFENIDEELKSFDYKILQLQSEEEKLKSEIVQETEADNLLLQQASILKSIDEQKEIEEARRENNSKLSNLNIELERITKKIQTILDIFSDKVLTSASKRKEFEQLLEEFEISKKIYEEKEADLNHFQSLYKEKDLKFIAEKKLGQKQIDQIINEINKLKTLIAKDDKISKEQKEKLNDADKLISNLIEQREFIIAKSTETFEIIIRTCI